MITDKTEILNRWAEFYQELYHNERETPPKYEYDTVGHVSLKTL